MITNWIIIHNDMLFTGSSDNTVKIWDIKTLTCIQTLTGHYDWIRCMIIHNNALFTASYDHTVKIWKK